VTADAPDFQHTVVVTLTPPGADNPDWQTTVTAPGGGAIGGYASLTGPGQTTTPGKLTQAGDFEVDSAGTTGVLLNNTGSGGISLVDDSNAGIAIVEHGAGIAEMQATGTGGVQLFIPIGASGQMVIFNTGSGGTLIEDDVSGMIIRQKGSGDLEIDNVGTGRVLLNGPNAAGVVINSAPTNFLSFFGVTAVQQQATPVTLADVIALLQAYGLSA
jgi:hypothetical protein